MNKKSRDTLPPIKSLHKICSTLWKQICFTRDGRQCQVQKYFPHINIIHSDILQVDHGFTRQDKNLFYEPDNGTVVCSNCNFSKHVQSHSVHRAIDIIIQRRIGIERYNELMAINQSMKPNTNFNKRWWLEAKIAELEEYNKNVLASKYSGTSVQSYDCNNHTVNADVMRSHSECNAIK